MGLAWYARRLRSMTPREITWRVARAGRDLLAPSRDGLTDQELFGAEDPLAETALQRFRENIGRPVLLHRAQALEIARDHPDQVASVIAAADRAVEGHVRYFGYPEVTLGRPVDWNYDPVADIHWPRVPASKIDHRTAVGDPKWIWELARLQHLPWLAEAWLFTGDERYAAAAFDQLDSWIEQNPPGIGVAWRGAFEVGVRAISIAVALQGLRESRLLTPERFRKITRVLSQGAARCRRDRSLYSSANNHLVGELAGLATVAILFPDVGPAHRWEGHTIRALAAEANRQILPDGAGAEQAVGYQIFTAELLLTVAVLLDSRGDPPPTEIVDALNRSADYLAAFVGDRDPDPRYGDDDEGFALRLGPEPLRTVRDHLGAVAAFTGNAAATRVGRQTVSSAWLRRTAAVRDGERVPPGDFFAPRGGMVVLRSGERRLTVDVGPLGYLSPAAHGHADALSLTLSVGGNELIGDPGAASYYGHPDWRTVHRGTRAHATVTVDGLDQSVIGGPFLWTRHARTRVHSVDLARGVVDAGHDGYRRLSDPVTHRRFVIAPPEWQTVTVIDVIAGRGTHEAETSWPLHPAVDVTAVGNEHLVTRNGVPVLHILHGASRDLVCEEWKGETTTGLGWWSCRLESREPSWLVGARTTGSVPLTMATVLTPSGSRGTRASHLEVAVHDAEIAVAWRVGDAGYRIEVDTIVGSVCYRDS